MEITPQELTTLTSFARYPLLTVEEVATLLYYSPSSVSYVNKLLSGLVTKKLLVRPSRPHVSKPYVYHISRRGVKLLRNNEIPATFTPYSYPMQLEHLQTTTALMMAIEKLPGVSPAFEIEDLFHDLVLKHTYPRMRPDVLSQISKHDKQTLLWWEVELQRSQRQFKLKIHELLQFFAKAEEYRNRKENELPTILILTTVAQSKALQLKYWVEAALESTDDTRKVFLFRIAYLPKEQFAPQRLFFEPIWGIPFQNDAVRLFDLA